MHSSSSSVGVPVARVDDVVRSMRRSLDGATAARTTLAGDLSSRDAVVEGADVTFSGGAMPFPRAVSLLVFADESSAAAQLVGVRACCTDPGRAGGRFAARVANVIAVLGGTTQGDMALDTAFHDLDTTDGGGP